MYDIELIRLEINSKFMKGNQIKEIRCVIWWHWFMSLTSGMSCDPAPVVTMELVTDDEEEALPVVVRALLS